MMIIIRIMIIIIAIIITTAMILIIIYIYIYILNVEHKTYSDFCSQAESLLAHCCARIGSHLEKGSVYFSMMILGR